MRNIETVCINIRRTFKLSELYTALLASQRVLTVFARSPCQLFLLILFKAVDLAALLFIGTFVAV